MPKISRYPGTQLLEYPYQVRSGVMGRLVLPNDLTRKEVERLKRFLDSLIDNEVSESNDDT